jgi:hypothetical protein
LVVDEVGYLPLERQAANLLFALVSRRYERGSIIITSNRGFEAWGEILGDAMVAAALIDRVAGLAAVGGPLPIHKSGRVPMPASVVRPPGRRYAGGPCMPTRGRSWCAPPSMRSTPR